MLIIIYFYLRCAKMFHLVSGVVTDNAAPNRAAWEILEKEFRESMLICYGCGSHATNLLMKNIIELPWTQNTIKLAISISKYFRNHSVQYAVLKQEQQKLLGNTIALQLPVPTRWSSYLDCLNSVYNSKDALQACVVKPSVSSKMQKDSKSDLRTIILDCETWEQLSVVIRLLKPFLDVILSLEKDTSRLSWVYRHYTRLQRWAKEEFIQKLPIGKDVEKFIEKRWQFIKKPVMSVAYILDPKNGAQSYSSHIRGEVEDFLLKYYGADAGARLYSQTSMLVTRTALFGSELVWQSANFTPPVAWWNANFKEDYPELTKLASRVLSMPASSASSERNWSAFKFIHSPSRNRLTNPRVQKLVSVYWNLRLLEDVKDSGIYFDTDDLEDASDIETLERSLGGDDVEEYAETEEDL